MALLLVFLLWLYHQGPWISNHMPSTMCDEITYLFPNFNRATVEGWEGVTIFFYIMAIVDILVPVAPFTNMV